jgi:PLD-like domain/Copper amine oxidase N-terminal domain
MKKILVATCVFCMMIPIILLPAATIDISLQIGNDTAYVDGEPTKLDSPPVIISGRTMVPLRFISESMGAEISWDGDTKTVIISQETPQVFFDSEFVDALVALIKSAKDSIIIQMHAFTNFEPVVEALESAGKSGVNVRIIADNFGSNNPSKETGLPEERLELAGCDVRWDTRGKTFNRKLCVVDSGKIAIGSHNWSASGMESNSEVSVVFTDSKQGKFIAEQFEQDWIAETTTIAWTVVKKESDEKKEDPDESQGQTPPANFVLVPANLELGINEPFYVSKYEMRIKGIDDGEKDYKESYVAESRVSGTPWTGLTMVEAKRECEALGGGYSLITNEEWMTIAHNIESVPSNWSDNKTHKTGRTDATLNVGNICRYGKRGTGARIEVGKKTPYSGEGVLEASEDDEEGCYGYKSYSAGMFGSVKIPVLNENGWNEYRRTHYLSNDEVIWDFSGNVWEWTDWYVEYAKDRARIDGHNDENYLEINACNTFSNKMKAINIQSLNPGITDVSRYIGENYYPDGEDTYGIKCDEYTNYNHLGRYHPTTRDRTAGAAMRGCSCMHGDSTGGIYSLAMGYGTDPDHIQCKVSFRCVWRPTK